MPSFTNTSPDSGFVPRKEFIREQRTTANAFALLTLAGSGFVRLYAFPTAVHHALRRLFDQSSLIAMSRQDPNFNFCEFALDGRPWVNAKSVASEKLLIDILAVIFRHGHLYLSTIDYGRERDDRLAIAFSKPCFLPDSPVRSGSPVPASFDPGFSGSITSHHPILHKVAFAVSFASSTCMRVISPPLDSTPAILQAVRGSWPRGVVSEKKVAEATFEFKLKGYRWFQEDTFAADSLHHILSILSSLDAHSFSLLTSFSLSNRSRTKDLWIFTGSSSPSDQETDSMSQSLDHVYGPDLKRALTSSPEVPTTSSSAGQHPQHRRYATSPNLSRQTHSPLHGKFPTNGNVVDAQDRQAQDSPAAAALRRALPKAQVPVSAVHDNGSHMGYRATLPSTVSSDIENMTGIGAANTSGWRGRPLPQPREVIFEASPDAEGKLIRTPSVIVTGPDPTEPVNPRTPSPNGPRALQPVSARAKTPPLLKSHPSTPVTTPINTLARTSSQSHRNGTPTSSKQNQLGGDSARQNEKGSQVKPKHSPKSSWSSHVGGEDKGKGQRDTGDDGEERQAVQEVASRVTLPEVTHPGQRPIKSEIGSIGVMAPTTIPPSRSPETEIPSAQRKGKGKAGGEGSMQGWVLVNVEGKHPKESGRSAAAPLQSLNGMASPMTSKSPTNGANMSAPAKTLAMLDAVDARSKSKSKPEGLKRLFGLRKSAKEVKESTPTRAPSTRQRRATNDD